MIPKKYLLNDGSIYWHSVYFDLMPRWTTRYSPPLGHLNYAAYFYQPHKYAQDVYLEMKWFIQRGCRGYSDSDVWGWCSHHSRMMVGVLKQLRRTTHGYPIGLSPARWDKKLKTMQEGFQAMVDEEDDVISYKKLSQKQHRKLMKSRALKLRKALGLFQEHYYNLWD